ncbi:fungal-specific transcription factor domain-containing protein [Aspergillus avenaceus]|uniref:Fungal-specific transcription factor domain-containing protein n=1 Tax=Aspergillus avenaceus TaxID=36643 RepID=A0A5N6TQW7_ASPAV|nr:fungal-specific transcription factor domain-containing protein [Aspergillus avenaceus]
MVGGKPSDGPPPATTVPEPKNRTSPPVAGKSGGRSKYAPKACQECRKRRAKCDGGKPSCSRCLGREIHCVYTTNDDARGTAPKSYVRLLQARIGILERILAMHSIDVDASAAQLLEQNTALLPSTNHTGSSLDELCDAFEGTLALDESLNFDCGGEPRYFGSTSGRLAFQTLPQIPPTMMTTCNHDQAVNLATQAWWNTGYMSEDLESHLLELYFTWEQPWFPVVDEALFRSSKIANGRYFSPLLLNCIFAVASRYSDRLEVRSDPNDSNTAGMMFLETAEALLSVDLKHPTITTLQSVAILGTVYVARGCDAAGWLHQGMASRMASDMGLHLDPRRLPSRNGMTEEEAELRRQIYWSLYSVDKLGASYIGRVCTMLDFQGAVDLPSQTSSGQEGEASETAVSCTLLVYLQRALSTLSQILEKILTNLYAPKRLGVGGQRQVFFESSLLMLKSWYYNLPVELRPVRSGTPNQFPQAYTLCMVYHTAVILLTKPYLPSSLCSQPPSPASGPVTSYSLIAQKASALHLQAAKQISSIGDLYRSTFGSFRKSPITATYSVLSAALALLQPPPQGTLETGSDNGRMDQIMPCLQTLKELSESWTPPRKYHENLLRVMQNQDSTPDEVVPSIYDTPPNPLVASHIRSEGLLYPFDPTSWGDTLPQLDYSTWLNSETSHSPSVTEGEVPGRPSLDSWPYSGLDIDIDGLP